MEYYVYQYLHPEYGHLYCGRTENLEKRIYEHDNLKKDNIPRKYESLLKESAVMYIELKNKAQGIAVEAYLIDKYKPYLNKALKYSCDKDEGSQLKMKLPRWKAYNDDKRVYGLDFQKLTNQKTNLLLEVCKLRRSNEELNEEIHTLRIKYMDKLEALMGLESSFIL